MASGLRDFPAKSGARGARRNIEPEERGRTSMDAPQPAPNEAPSQSASPLPAVLAIVGGLLVILGSFLTWFSVTADASALGGGSATISVNGMDGDGTITLVAGIVLVILGIVMFVMRGRNLTAISIIALLGGVVAALVAVYDITTAKSNATDSVASTIAAQSHGQVSADQARQVLTLVHFNISVGIGVILVAIAGVVGAIGGALGIRASRMAATPGGAVAVTPPPYASPPAETASAAGSPPPMEPTPPVDQPPPVEPPPPVEQPPPAPDPGAAPPARRPLSPLPRLDGTRRRSPAAGVRLPVAHDPGHRRTARSRNVAERGPRGSEPGQPAPERAPVVPGRLRRGRADRIDAPG